MKKITSYTEKIITEIIDDFGYDIEIPKLEKTVVYSDGTTEKIIQDIWS